MAGAAEDVIINFVGNTDELKPVENALDDIIEKGDAVGEAWKKTAAAMLGANKISVDSTNKLAKSIEAIAVASKSMDKAVVGGAYKEYLKQIQFQLGLTNKEVIAYVQNSRKAAQESIFSAETDEEIDQITLSIQAMNDQLAELGAAEDQAGEKTESLRSRLRAAKEELVAMAEAGLAGTPAFEELLEKAGELDDQMKDLNATVGTIGSDTKNIDGLISIASGVAGGFAVAQGAAALFGDENEDLQRALLKVNAAMAILQGIQQVANVLQKESAASIFLTNLFRKQQAVVTTEATVATASNVVATEALVVAEAEQVVATEAATVAQVQLNTAMSLNPIGLMIAAIVALIGVMAILTRNEREAHRAQLDLNDAQRDATQGLETDLKSLQQFSAKQKALAQEQGASAIELTRIEAEEGNKRLALINQRLTTTARAINKAIEDDQAVGESYQKLTDRKKELEDQLQDELNALQVKGIEFRKTLADNELTSFIANSEAKVLAARSGSIAEKNAQIQSIRETRAAKDALNPDLTPGERAKNAAEDARSIADIELDIYAAFLKSRTAMSEATVAQRKAGILKNQVDTIASIEAVTKAEIAAIRARTNEQIKSNPNLSGGEIAKINAEANLQILELQKAQEVKLLEIKQAGINALLIAAQKGSQEEYNARLQFITREQQIALAAAELTSQQIAEINAKFNKQKEEASRAFNEAQIQNIISLDNAALDQFGLTEDQKLVLTLKRLEDQRELEISQAEKNGAKIAEINAKYDKQIIESKRATIEATLADNLRALDVFGAESVRVNQRIVDAQGTTGAEKIKALEQLQKFNDDKFDLEHRALTKQVEDNLLTTAQFNIAYQELLNRRAEGEELTQQQITQIYLTELEKRTRAIQATFEIFQRGVAATMDTSAVSVALTEMQNFGTLAQDIIERVKLGALSGADAIRELALAAVAATQAIINQSFADASAARQQALSEELSRLEEQKQRELDNESLTQEQKAAIDAKYRAKEKQEKIKAFQADKEAKKSQAIMNGALAVTNALLTTPLVPLGLAMAALVVASTAIQVSKISSTPVPKFRHGKVDIQGPGTKTSDSIPAMISRGESVMTADVTTQWKDALLAMSENRFPQYMANKFDEFVFPKVPDDVQHIVTPAGIDYSKLAKAVAMEMKGVMPAPASIEVINDAQGQRAFIREANSTIEYRNKRYYRP